MQYKGAHRPLPEIAQSIGVDGILEGSVERAGDKVHVTIQLIHAPSDTHLGAESYDRNASDVVTLPEDAAQSIAKRLDSTAPPPKPGFSGIMVGKVGIDAAGEHSIFADTVLGSPPVLTRMDIPGNLSADGG
jgi:hypothetical protein